ncbi:MAG TPA: hypothetical protein VER17_02295 [Tepidisphaeraceae bacterium]|nr:hypothetical protein [Tepidisphaeraceae bacterium]
MLVAGAAETEVIDAERPPEQANPFLQVHRLLRGRYWLAALLCVLGGGLGGYAGYRVREPLYQSTGVIRIKPSLPRVLYQIDQNGVMPMFDAFIESQVALITSQRVIDVAMQHPEWKALGRGLAPEQMAAFAKGLSALHPQGSELVLVKFEDTSPDAARRAVAAVIDAYDRLYGENDSESAQSRMKLLEERRTTLSGEYKNITDQIRAIADTTASSSIDQLYGGKLNRLLEIEAQLQQAEIALALSGRPPTTAPSAAKPSSVAALAMQVPEIARLLGVRRELERQLVADRTQFGEKHRYVIEGAAKLESLTAQIDELVRFYQDASAEGGAGQAMALATGMTPEQLKANEANIRKLYDRLKTETDELGRKCLDIDQLRAKAEDVKTRLDETNQRIDQLNIEAGVGGRISIESRGDPPLGPAKDQRKMFAVAGAAGTGGAGVGLVLLLGLLDRRIRHISDVRESLSTSCNRVLGVLPLLPDEDSDPEDAMIAAHGVHQIRMLLQHRFAPGTKPVLAVTSAMPGSGKTSLTMALGLSFAASGARTLLIDCDIVGGGLTSKMKKVSRRRLGHILRRVGLINTEQLVSALKESKRRRERVGVTLVRNGWVSEADVAHALEVQRHELVGLREALCGDPANECITGAGTGRLFLMPLGSAQRQHVAQLSYPALRRVIDQVRGWFDVVIIDTGPILGSLEAAAVAMAADEVVLTVSKGEQRPSVDRAVEQLTAAGGRLAGIVLNRAGVGDILRSGFSSSTSRVANDSPDEQVSAGPFAPEEHHTLRLGPIGSAVLSLGESPAAAAGREAAREAGRATAREAAQEAPRTRA